MWWNNPHSIFEQKKVEGFPFGFIRSPEGGVEVQDFAYNLVFFRGIHDHVVAHPYRLEDQEKLVHQLLPGMTAGMSHGYSPVGLVLAWPLLQMPGSAAYLLYDLLTAGSILVLFHFYFLPRTESLTQISALGICSVSVCVMLAFGLGQTSLLTTSLLAMLWILLPAGDCKVTLARDLIVALLFWALCLKPSIAIIPFALLLGEKAWRPLLIGFLMIGLTWIFLAPYYGGWWTGLQDYAYLLNHYNNADFTPFMRRDYIPGHDAGTRNWFAFNRWLTESLTFASILARWQRWISRAELLQGMIGIFLLFSPYLLPSEDWILCLLVVTGDFFRDSTRLTSVAKLAVLFGIMDLRGGTIVPWSVNFPLLCVLFGWMLLKASQKRPGASERVRPAV